MPDVISETYIIDDYGVKHGPFSDETNVKALAFGDDFEPEHEAFIEAVGDGDDRFYIYATVSKRGVHLFYTVKDRHGNRVEATSSLQAARATASRLSERRTLAAPKI